MQIGDKRSDFGFGLFSNLLFSGEKNAAKTTFDCRKILNDGGTGKKPIIKLCVVFIISELSIKKVSLLFDFSGTFVLHTVTFKVLV